MANRNSSAVHEPSLLEPQSLRSLAARRDRACVSLFAPLDGGEPHKAHQIRMENLIAAAHEALARRLDEAEANRVLEPVRRLISEGAIERDAGAAVAVFADTSGTKWCYLPWAAGSRCDVGERFTVKPLAPAVADDVFHVVALSKDRVRLYRADRGDIVELTVDDLPSHGIDDVPGAEAETNRLQMHSGKQGRGPRGGMTEVVFHGHRDDTKGENEVVARLCRQTSEALRRSGRGSDAPVVVAAVERLAATFRREVGWAHVVGVVVGNPDAATARELHRRALPLVERHLRSRMQARAENLGDAVHNGLGSTDLASIVLAAHDGRVDTLFVNRRAVRWGRLEPGRREVVVNEIPKPTDDDLVDRAISDTLAQGGDIVPFIPDLPGDGGAVAALYRH